MSLPLVIMAVALAASSGLPAFLLRRAPTAGQGLSSGLLVASALLGLAGAALGLGSPPGEGLILPWQANGGAELGMDPLSAFFLVPVFLVGGLGAIYETAYRPARRHLRTRRRSAAFQGLLVAGLAILIIARDAFAFILGWEAMALSAFFLIALDDDRGEARRAGLIYLIATHAGTLILFGLFAYWHRLTGSFALVAPPPGTLDRASSTVVFVLALLAFGLKAGVMPLHFWLPGAHAAAPSNVSAMLSGVVLKMGIYGLMRFILILPSPPPLWGGTILFLGAASSLLGVAFAIAQHDLKRLLAYHSVENIGIIMMGLGISLLGAARGRADLAALGMAAALLHVWNHSLFKSLLFLGAGSVVERSGTRHIDLLGGLSRTMPWTAGLFLVGAVAISGLPPLNGFVSEFLLYFGAFKGGSGANEVAALLVVPVLAATGALALACFVKVYGAVFLGLPRRPLRPGAGESPVAMIASMAVLGFLCLLIGLAPSLVGRILDPVLAFWSLARGEAWLPIGALAPLALLGTLGLALIVAIAAIGLLFFRLSRRREGVAAPGTWDCGYAEPTSRMQYTASSFGRSISSLFAWLLRPRVEAPRVEGSFPAASRMESHVDDMTLDGFILPLSASIGRRFGWIRSLQQGLTQNYLVYVLLALIVLLCTLFPFGDFFKSLLAG